jgi:hypothetical protein
MLWLMIWGCADEPAKDRGDRGQTDPCSDEEVPYDGVDNDCDGGDLVDVDEDGAAAVEAGGDDCDDTDPEVVPGAPDPLGDGVDQDCDGADGALVGRTWAVDLDAGTWTEPHFFEVFGNLFTERLAVHVVAAEGSSLTLRWGGLTGVVQAGCATTAEVAASLGEGAVLTSGPDALDLYDGDLRLPASDLTFQATVTDDGASLVVGALDFRLDTSGLGRAWLESDEDDPDDVCDFLGTFGVSCEPCTDGGPERCMAVRIEALTGEDLGLPLAPRTADDVAAEPACDG